MTGRNVDFEECGDIRLALGVYVVGAIDPAERAIVDIHLAHCPDCREELAALAGLPALLGRVPVADAERIALGADDVPEEPNPALLDSLLQQVSSRRRARRLRFVQAAAAAAIIAIGTGLGVGTLVSHSHGRPSAPTVMPTSGLETGVNSADHVEATIYFDSQSSGTRMRVQVSGLPAGETCVLWVITRSGEHVSAGQWTSGPAAEWYSESTSYQVSQLQGFDVSVNGQVQVTVPLSTR